MWSLEPIKLSLEHMGMLISGVRSWVAPNPPNSRCTAENFMDGSLWSGPSENDCSDSSSCLSVKEMIWQWLRSFNRSLYFLLSKVRMADMRYRFCLMKSIAFVSCTSLALPIAKAYSLRSALQACTFLQHLGKLSQMQFFVLLSLCGFINYPCSKQRLLVCLSTSGFSRRNSQVTR